MLSRDEGHNLPGSHNQAQASTRKNAQIQRRVLFNTLTNYVGQIIVLGTGFLFTPFVLHYLGPSTYGLWVLVSSIVAYGTLLDFGLLGAVIKYVAEFRARGEVDQARGLVVTALWLYIGLGLLAICLGLILAPLIPQYFNIAAADQGLATRVVLLSALSLGLSIPCTITSGVLHGLQRFDLANIIAISGTLLATLTTVIVLMLGGGILEMVAAGIPIMLLMQIPSVWLIKRIAPELRFGLRGGSRALVRTVTSFSSSMFLTNIAGHIQTKTDEIVIGAFLPLAAVTPYALARRLSETAQLLTNQFLRVLLPVASELHAENDSGRLQGMYFITTRLTLALFLPIGLALTLLAGELLRVWVGPDYSQYAYLVAILTAAGFFESSQLPGGSVVQGMSRHRPLAFMSIGAAIANLVLSIVLVQKIGLIGVAIGTLIPTAIGNIGLVLPYTLRTLGIHVGEVVRQIFIPTLVPAIPSGLLIWFLERLTGSASLIELGLIAVAGLIVYVTAYLCFRVCAVERTAIKRLTHSALRRFGAHT